MATQLDSIDISKLRDYALELNELDLPEHELDVSPIPGASTDGQAKAVHPKRDRTLQNYSTKVPLKDAPNGEERTSGQHPRSRSSTSPSQLPSTIPESIAARTAAMASQSEGDTQPLSQGVREEFASKIREHHAGLQSEVASESGTTWNSASHSYQPGETGHIDLLADFEQPSGNDTQEFGEAVDDDIEPDSQPTDVRVELFPESRRFQQPITPAATSRKRQRVESSASRENTTPRLPVNPFAGQPGCLDGMMNASQAFKATQFTSPLPNGLPSDALSDRPSPDLFNAQRPSTADPVSSPVRLPHSRMTRAVTEPQTTYISLEESQKERERRKREDETAQVAAALNASGDDSDSEDSEFRRRRIRRKIDLESRDVLASITAKARSTPNRRGRGGRKQQTPRATSTRKAKMPERDPVIISDDPDADGNVTEDETEKEEENNRVSDTDSLDELTEENKENFDGKDLQIPLSVSRINLQRASAKDAVDGTPLHHPLQNPAVTSNHRSDVINENSRASIEEIPAGAATVAIADSQPSRPIHEDPASRLLREHTEIRNSSEEHRLFIPQSQWSVSSTANPSRTGVSGSEEPTCVPASSTGPSLQRRNSEVQQGGKPSNLLPSEESSRRAPEPSRSMGTPMNSVPMRSSPPQLEVNSGVTINDETIEIGTPSTAPHTMRSEGSEPRHNVALPAGNLTFSMHGENLLQMKSPQKSNQLGSFRTIPGTSSAELNPEPTLVSSVPPASAQTSSRPDLRIISTTTNETRSGPSTLFDTAPTQMTNSPQKSSAGNTPQRPQRATVTPSPKITRPRTLLEITNATSPPNPMNDMDLDVNLMTAEDIEFQAVINGSSPVRPARKRRRGPLGRVVDVEEPESDKQPTTPVLANGPEANDEAVESVNPAKDQLRNDAASTAAVKPAELSPAKGVTKPPILERSASRKRGRPKKSSLSAISGEEPPAAGDGNKMRPKNAARSRLPPIQTTSEPTIVDEGRLSNASVVAPNRVFAHFNGNYPAYYPATCIGLVGGKEPQYRVRFDDGTVDVINGYGIKRLELRPGDNVKLDVGGIRKGIYVVIKMQDRQQPMLTPDPETPTGRSLPGQASTTITTQTDINGYASVLVSSKQAKGIEQQDDQSLTVPVRDVYVTQNMWHGLKDCAFTYARVSSHHSSRLETPLERSSIPSTPSSRAQRIKTSGLGISRSAKPHSTVRSTLFKNMVFAVTNIAVSTSRTSLNNLINDHGGRLLSEDFSELFNIPSLGPSSPSKRSPKRDIDPTFHLTTAASRMGFTCLIADKHCRMAKYIQALALGIPCLSPRWVQDCVAKQEILAWEPYLLAAGESAFLNGAVRSRIIPSHDPLSVTLPEMFDARPKPLDKASVLLIMEKQEEETMRSHPLLSHALGARKVSRATNLDAAAKMLAEAETNGDTWDWVYSHDKEEKVEKVLFARGKVSSSGVGHKRKRGSSAMSRMSEGEGSKTRVVGNEFVIQSLILGRLVSMD